MTLEQIKRHLNIDDEFTEDDEYIMSLYEVAVELVQRHIDMTFDELLKMERFPSLSYTQSCL